VTENSGCGVPFRFRKSPFFCCAIVFSGTFILEMKARVRWAEEGIMMKSMTCQVML
jgi:hypothetical protein